MDIDPSTRFDPVPKAEAFSANIAFLLARAQDMSFSAFARLAGQKGLKPGHYAILQFIADRPGISQIELSREVGRDKATITPILQGFQKHGLVTRRPDPGDGRGRKVYLTAAGVRHLDELRACAQAHDAALDALAGDDKQQFLRTLQTIISGFA
ncbi:MarR family transcriptional regulator [Novosphingobium sp.]|uniref:MarR family winged helix-turn-helix transcriptional regulator n=1 Tax=Novosphingobium sp. TaxID=1874826 RepID=UPI0031D5D369